MRIKKYTTEERHTKVETAPEGCQTQDSSQTLKFKILSKLQLSCSSEAAYSH